MVDLYKNEFKSLKDEIFLLQRTVCILASGNNEWIANGSAKSISRLLNGAVSENEEQEV
jgi:hypothetical protein